MGRFLVEWSVGEHERAGKDKDDKEEDGALGHSWDCHNHRNNQEHPQLNATDNHPAAICNIYLLVILPLQ